MQFDRGYLSPYFDTEPAKMTANLEDCVILLHEKKLTSLAPMVPLLEAVMQADKQLLVTIWLADMVDFDEMNAVWDAWVPTGHAPACACGKAKVVGSDLLVEIIVTAAVAA
ncbi:Rid family hydrolase [Sulfitobacter sp. F26169L]|uniref:Rid family hydrolase n=1 Tax=Sulfitobacter sp. F26169L TaxID=2996015 RepID=UPI0022609ACC|nr:Rid family hydrolase [Sulfitobacter sp. F26169L]